MARSVVACISVAGMFIFFSLFQSAAYGQLLPPSPDEHSAAFSAPFEAKEESALQDFRKSGLESLSADALARLQSANADDYGLNEQLLSLDLFQSLASYYRKLPFAAESRIDDVLTNAPSTSRTATNAALLGALEFYAHTPLNKRDVKAGVARLNAISDVNASAAAIQPEIWFWKAEGYCALGKYHRAEKEYRNAIARSSEPLLTALTYFRLAELNEREQEYADADSNFAAASRIRQSPLVLLSLLRLGAAQRLEKNYDAVLTTMQEVDSLFRITEHIIRNSSRNLDYTSPLIEALMLKATERDRIIGSAPEDTARSMPPQLVSPFYLSEVDLLRGSALSGLGRYEDATAILEEGRARIESVRGSAINPSVDAQAQFIADALRFEAGWSLFERAKYQDASAAFLELAVTDTSHPHLLFLGATGSQLREQGTYFDPFLNDSAAAAPSAPVPTLQRSTLEKNGIDTASFVYNDFPERARYYAGVALARAGMLNEAADALEKLAYNPSMLYSTEAMYQLALIRFEQHSYEAQKLLEPVSYEQSVRGAYASFLLGEMAYRRNDYERAEGYFLNAFANLPAKDTAILATAHLERGLSLIPLDNWSEAANELSKYLAMSNERIPGRTDEALFWMGKAYFRAGEYDSAQTTFSRLLSEYPESNRREDAQYGYAWSLFDVNDFAGAAREFERLLVMDSISRYAYDALAHAGDSYYALGETKRANKLYNLSTDRPGFNPLRITRATLMLGITRMKIDSERSAMNAFEIIMRKYATSDLADLADFDYALAAYAINLNGEAEATVEKIVTHYRESSVAPRALYVAGEERVRHGDESGALHYYEHVINKYPRSSEAGPALFALQDALADLKRIPEALAVADTFVERNPKNPISPMVLLRAGEFQMKLHDPAAAFSSVQLFLSQYPTNAARPHAELLLAESELAMEDTDKAVSQLDTIIMRYDSVSEGAAAYLDLARIERARKNFDSAALQFEHAYQERYYSFDAAPEAMFEYGEMLAQDRKSDSAIHLLLEIAHRYPIQASIVARGAMRAGTLLSGQREYDSARAIFLSVIAAHPLDALGGVASVEIGESYMLESNWTKAASTFTEARHDFALTPESDGERLLGLARADAHLGREADAIRNLHMLLSMHHTPEAARASAKALLDALQPPVKKKQKKGGTQ